MDKHKQMALISRRRGELTKALREGLGRFRQLGIRADVYAPKGKDSVAYLLIDENDLAKFFQRRTVSRMRKLGKDINVKSTMKDDVLITKIISRAEVNEEDVNKDVSRVKEELSKMKIKSEVFVDVKDYVNLTILMDVNSIVEYIGEQVKKAIESKRIKVTTTVYRENNVLVVRFAK